jgi:hypothetical protein
MSDQGSHGEFTAAAVDILRRERAAIMGDQGVWREIWINLGFTRRDPTDLPLDGDGDGVPCEPFAVRLRAAALHRLAVLCSTGLRRDG